MTRLICRRCSSTFCAHDPEDMIAMPDSPTDTMQALGKAVGINLVPVTPPAASPPAVADADSPCVGSGAGGAAGAGRKRWPVCAGCGHARDRHRPAGCDYGRRRKGEAWSGCGCGDYVPKPRAKKSTGQREEAARSAEPAGVEAQPGAGSPTYSDPESDLIGPLQDAPRLPEPPPGVVVLGGRDCGPSDATACRSCNGTGVYSSSDDGDRENCTNSFCAACDGSGKTPPDLDSDRLATEPTRDDIDAVLDGEGIVSAPERSMPERHTSAGTTGASAASLEVAIDILTEAAESLARAVAELRRVVNVNGRRAA